MNAPPTPPLPMRCANCLYLRTEKIASDHASATVCLCEHPGKIIYGPHGARLSAPRTLRTAWCYGFIERPAEAPTPAGIGSEEAARRYAETSPGVPLGHRLERALSAIMGPPAHPGACSCLACLGLSSPPVSPIGDSELGNAWYLDAAGGLNRINADGTMTQLGSGHQPPEPVRSCGAPSLQELPRNVVNLGERRAKRPGKPQ
jgi:hypothetical protein